jgi:hypothetical protein
MVVVERLERNGHERHPEINYIKIIRKCLNLKDPVFLG